RNRALLQHSIDRRLAGEEDAIVAHELNEAIEKENWGGWIAADREEVLENLHAIMLASNAGRAAPDVPVAAVEQLEHIDALAKRRDFANAVAELDNLLIAYPGNAALFAKKCELMLFAPGVADA